MDGKDTITAFGEGTECRIALSNFSKNNSWLNCPSSIAGKCLNEAPAIINPYGWIGYDGFGDKIISPGDVIAWARLANPSFDPSVTTTSLSGSNLTPNLRS